MTLAPPVLVHPGPVADERVVAVATRLVAHELPLPAGVPLLTALDDVLHATGARSACGELVGGRLAEFSYFIPDVGAPGGPVANFSPPHTGRAPARLVRGGLTVGHRDGSLFAHSHALFVDATGERRAGHLIPDSVVLGDNVLARLWTASDVALESVPDPETGMTLFVPRATAEPDAGPDAGPDASRGGVDAVMCRVRPNVDLVGVIESVADAQGWDAAHVRGQIGSLVGAHLRRPDGSVDVVDGPATEVMYVDGTVRRAGGRMTADLTAGLVDRHARLHEGALVAGLNPVAMTFELTLTRASTDA
ncbi:DUF296 domain-containing protein [Nocardioides sp. C4-1]|uniref:PCC domain-containing protein n=1 Tax=Nocardioides sp. C4-1 TaxID=3151851 RepID=UPI003263C410